MTHVSGFLGSKITHNRLFSVKFSTACIDTLGLDLLPGGSGSFAPPPMLKVQSIHTKPRDIQAKMVLSQIPQPRLSMAITRRTQATKRKANNMMLKSALKAHKVDSTTSSSTPMPSRSHQRSTANKRSVTFASRSRARTILSRYDLTRAEIDSIWLTPEEVASARQDVEDTVQELRDTLTKKKNGLPGQPKASGTSCYRGLEHLSSEHNFNFLLAAREFHRDAVLYVQREYVSLEAIAQVSRDITGSAKERAYLLGKADEAVARRLSSSQRVKSIINVREHDSPTLASARSA